MISRAQIAAWNTAATVKRKPIVLSSVEGVLA